MKLNSDLLNEVIADAKAVRETAVQTAISRLKETFEPTVRNLISQKLREEGEEPAEDDTEMEMPEEKPAPTPAPEEEPVAEDMDDYTDDTYDEIFEEDDYLDNGDEDEDFLAQVLGELDDYPNEDDVMTPGDVESIYEDDYMTEPTTEEEDDKLENYSEEELDEMIAELEGELGAGMDSDDEEEDETAAPMMENFAWGEEEYDFQNDFGRIVTENKKLKRQLRGAQRHLKEAYKAINTQKSAINEVNLLNSKLLFLTKITSKHQLTPQKQVKILEAFDRAQTVREVKLVYATIAESLSKDAKAGLKARGINESASRPARVVKQSLNENYDFAKRWRELAGIK
jgi:hypothetical protein